jgi:hypothetical protein
MLAIVLAGGPKGWLQDLIQSGPWGTLLALAILAAGAYGLYHLSGAAWRDRMSRTPEERAKLEWEQRKALEEKWEAERKRDQRAN